MDPVTRPGRGGRYVLDASGGVQPAGTPPTPSPTAPEPAAPVAEEPAPEPAAPPAAQAEAVPPTRKTARKAGTIKE